MANLSFFVFLAILGASIVFIILQMRRTRRIACRLAWLRERNLLISLSELSKIANTLAAVIQIDFGSGKEVWVTRTTDEKMMIHPSEPIICNGFRLYPDSPKADVDNLSNQFGLKKFDILSLNNSTV